MQNVKAIIDLFGRLAGFRHVRLEVAEFMPLVIEAVGIGPGAAADQRRPLPHPAR
jgi:hypothetical protein